MKKPRVHDLRYADLETFLAVRHAGSVTAAARSMSVTPSQVSKAIARLEDQLGAPVFTRTKRGLVLTELGQRMMPHLEEITSRLRIIASADAVQGRDLTVAAPSYLASPLLGNIVSAHADKRVRGLIMAPSLIRAFATENLFDVALTTGDVQFPEPWDSTYVGELEESLFGAPATVRALGRQPIDPEALAEVTFVGAIDGVNAQLVPLNDGCPLGRERKFGHQAVQFGLALDFAAYSDQVVYGMRLAAAEHVARGALKEIRVRGWNHTLKLNVVVNGNRVRARVRDSIVECLRKALTSL